MSFFVHLTFKVYFNQNKVYTSKTYQLILLVSLLVRRGNWLAVIIKIYESLNKVDSRVFKLSFIVLSILCNLKKLLNKVEGEIFIKVN